MLFFQLIYYFYLQVTEGERPVPNLTDSKTQIDASLSQDSLDLYRKQSPDKPLNKDVKGSTIVLYDFDVVFDYASSQPSAHLYVKSFAIAWERGRFKGPPLGRKLKKHPSTAHAIGKALAKLREPAPKSACRETLNHHISQPNETPYKLPTQHFTQSQTQAQTQAPLILDSEFEHIDHHLSHGGPSTDSLLGYLAPGTTAIGNTGDLNIAQSANGQTLDQKGTEDEISSQPCSQPEISGYTSPSPAHDLHHSAPPISPPESTRPLAQPHAQPGGEHVILGEDEEMEKDIKPGAKTAVEKEPSDTPVTQPAGQSHTEHSTEQTPRSNQKTNITAQIARLEPDQTQADPWSGMRRIRKSDITVPSNQQQFFEREARIWVPPPLGEELPRACVPPALLSQWNRIVLKRARSSAEKQPTPVPTQDMSPEPAEHSSVTPELSPTPDDGTPLPWDRSPSAHLTSRRALPDDSSPVRPRPKQMSPKMQVREPRTQVDGSQTDAPVESPTTKPAKMDDSRVVPGFSLEKDPIEGHESGADGFAPDQTGERASSATRQPESDDESEDSVMDTSVPCPLVGSSQAYLASQSDQGVSSSGPSLPAAPLQERVQVTETPAPNHRHRIHLMEQAKDDRKEHHGPLPAESKSSSQSRIFNTYATHDSAQTGTRNTPQASQADGDSQHIDIMGTQLSNVAWSTQDRLPISSSAIPNSTYQSDASSKPFSSHDEMISSIEADEKIPTAFDGSAPDISMQSMAPSPLKRPASGEAPPTAKRQRPSKDSSRRRESTLPTVDIVSRRESYISHTDDCAEAQRVFEKFRNDYPSYVGDFAHFTELCSKLHTLRSRGCLTRSFLWDDFIIKHLEVYTPYREEHLSTETKVPPYEDFFLSNYSKPSYKKRSLTAGGIEKATSQYISATTSRNAMDTSPLRNEANTPFTGSLEKATSQYVSASASNSVMDTSPLRKEASTSFTGSLVAKFSEFHAHSLGPEPPSTASNHDADRMSVSKSSPVPQDEPSQRTPAVREDSPDSDNELFVRADSPDTPVPPPANPSHEQRGPGPVIPETESERDTESESESEDEHESNEDIDMMDETHETASLELGEGEESDSENENWFVSLRHIRDPGEGWWDDPNTPLKKWAREDQNVRSERVFRRGWAQMPVDEKGVIQPWLLGLK